MGRRKDRGYEEQCPAVCRNCTQGKIFSGMGLTVAQNGASCLLPHLCRKYRLLGTFQLITNIHKCHPLPHNYPSMTGKFWFIISLLCNSGVLRLPWTSCNLHVTKSKTKTMFKYFYLFRPHSMHTAFKPIAPVYPESCNQY